jgi:PAS domain S-box-containing protein
MPAEAFSGIGGVGPDPPRINLSETTITVADQDVLARHARVAAALLRSPLAILVPAAADQPPIPSVPEPLAAAAAEGLRAADGFWKSAQQCAEPFTTMQASEPLLGSAECTAALDRILPGGARAWVGAPLLTADGRSYGSLCVFASEPRGWTAEEMAALQDLALAAAREMDLRGQVAELEAEVGALGEAADRRFHDLVDGLQAIFWEADAATFQFTFVSRGAEEILGYPVRDWLTDPDFWVNILHPQDRHWAPDFCLRETREGRDHTFEYRAQAAGGREVWLRDVVYVVRDEAGAVSRLRGVMFDITDRKRAEHERGELLEAEQRARARAEAAEQRSRELVESVDAIVLEADAHTWEISYVSRGVERILGYPVNQWLAEPDFWVRTLHPEDREQAISFCRTATAEGKDHVFEYRALRADGGVVWMRDHVRVIFDAAGQVRQLRSLIVDITQQKAADEAVLLRASQQAAVAHLGQVALAGGEISDLLEMASELLVANLDVDYSVIAELLPNRDRLRIRTGTGWNPDHPGEMELPAGRGSLAGYALECGKSLVVEDLRKETRFEVRKVLRDHGVISAGCAVIQDVGRPFGVLAVHSTRRQTLTPDAVHFLQSVANVLGTAVQRRRAEMELAAIKDQLTEQLQDMTRLHEQSARLSRTVELQPVLDEAVTAVARLLGGPRSLLLLHDGESDRLRTASSFGFTEEELTWLEQLPADSGACGRALEQRQSVLNEDLLAEDSPLLAEAHRVLGVRAIFGTPLLTRAGEVLGALVVYFDDQHRPEEREVRLAELYAGQASNAIENARLYRQLQEADRRKDQFLAMLSHELRNPLTPIRNALEVMRLRDPNTRDSLREVLERQARHLTRLTDDLMDVSRVTRGKIALQRERRDLRHLLQAAVRDHSGPFEAAGLVLDFDVPEDPVPVEVDPTRLSQVVGNLLQNALKFTGRAGVVSVRLEVDPSAREARVSVTDTGAGIAPNILPHVFEPFAQGEMTLARTNGGLGLGLALVRGLIELHGGSVRALSEGPGRGSRFEFVLPLAVDAELRPTPDAAPAASVSARVRRRVLIIDDNPDVVSTLRTLLELAEHSVETALDGMSGLAKAESQRPHAIFCDLGLPGMDGYAVARSVRSHPALGKCLLVAISGYGQEDDRRRSRAAGFDHHLTKPVEPQRMLCLLDALDAPEEPRVES